MSSEKINQPPEFPDRAFAGVCEPGNGSRYEYIVWRTGSQWFAAFPNFSRASRIGNGTHRPDYVGEKFHCSQPDAEVMANIINACFEAAEFGPGTMVDFVDKIRNG